MKNYYDELEVSKTASKEVIGKVYKVLAKKYHPDTTKELDKQSAEEKFKAISEAYEILSNDEKRKEYDLELERANPIISYEEYIDVVNQRDFLSQSLANLKNELYNLKNSTNNYSQNYTSTQTQYNHVNSNFNNNSEAYTSYQNMSNNTNPNKATSKKRTYYYTNTGKPASAFAYFKYKIKEFFTNIFLIILSIVAAILILNAFSNFDLFNFFIK